MASAADATTLLRISSSGPANSPMRAAVSASFHDRGIHDDGLADGFGDISVLVEGDVQLAEEFAVGIGLHDSGVANHRRVWALGAIRGVRQVGVVVSADDDIDAGCLGRDALVDNHARMAEHDDLVHAFRGQPVDLALNRGNRGRRR